MVQVTSSACSLRWVLSAFFMKRVGDLKKLFAAVDRDSSGSVSRIELSAALERKANRLPDLEAFLTALRDKLGIDEEAVSEAG